MKTADWIGLTILGAVLVGGGAYLASQRGGMFNGNAVLSGAVDQGRPGVGVPLPQTPGQNNTVNDIKSGFAIAKEGVSMLRDLFAEIESFGD